MKNTILLLLVLISLMVACLENPTADELGLDLSIRTDKTAYKPGESIDITVTNMGEEPIRIFEVIASEESMINYEKTPDLLLKVSRDGTNWTWMKPFESERGSQFPFHLQPTDFKRWTSRKLTTRFAGHKIQFALKYWDNLNRHAFLAQSDVIDIEAE